MKVSQLAINSVSTRGAGLGEMLGAYAEAGFGNVEFCLPQIKEFFATGGGVADVRGLLAKHHLQCIGGFEQAVQAFAASESRAANHEQIVANAALIEQLGGGIMVVGTDGPADGAVGGAGAEADDPLDTLAATFAELGKRVKAHGITLCIEFNWSPVIKSLRTAVEVARRSGAANVGVLFDPAHYHCTPTKFDQINSTSVGFIRHVHLDDMNDKPGELSNCNADRVLPGRGILPLAQLIAELERHGYRGFFSIEMFNEALWRTPLRQASKAMYESLLPLTDHAS
jgi:sugar phosphate isomerase/epimerase